MGSKLLSASATSGCDSSCAILYHVEGTCNKITELVMVGLGLLGSAVRHFPFFSCFPLLKPVSSSMVDHR